MSSQGIPAVVAETLEDLSHYCGNAGMSAEERVKELIDIINYSSDSIYVTDGEGNTILVNEAFENMSGIRREDVIGKNVCELEDEAVFTPSVTSLVLRESRKITIIQELRNGTKVIATGVPIFDEDGNLYRIVSNSKSLGEIHFLNEYIKMEKPDCGGPCLRSDDIIRNVIYTSEKIDNILELIRDIAPLDTTVLLTGESGVGKSLFARIIHELSARKNFRFVQINCGAIPEGLLESELFGYEGGAFSGARKEGKKGLLEIAQGGTIFLDEIGELPVNLQVKLLHAIQNREITRVGGIEPVKIDARIISATNKNLEEEVREGRFRIDLYYRLNIVPVLIPPLRQRKSDIIPLAQYFLQCLNRRYNRNVFFSSKAFDELLSYSWPGNIRELENVIERLVVTSRGEIVKTTSGVISHDEGSCSSEQNIVVNDMIPLRQAREELEKQLVRLAYEEGGSSYKVAEILDISQASAHRKIQKYIDPCNS